MRTFKLNRKTDKTGTSGTGLVAIGLEYQGRVFLAWIVTAKLDDGRIKMIQTLTLFQSIQDVQDLHGHGGASQVEIDSTVDLNTVKTIKARQLTLGFNVLGEAA